MITSVQWKPKIKYSVAGQSIDLLIQKINVKNSYNLYKSAVFKIKNHSKICSIFKENYSYFCPNETNN